MKVYRVLKYSDAIHYQEDKTFSSFPKALRYIEKQLNGITHIRDDLNGKYWKGTWYYKKYYSEVEWAEILTDRKNIENRKYLNYHCYSIEVIEVL